jgi:hypothetical protein
MRRIFGIRSQRGQSLAEFAAVLPILILLVGGIIYACFYGFRSTAADWGVFAEGVAAGSYDPNAMALAHRSVVWPDIRDSISWTREPEIKSARTWISVENTRPGLLGVELTESYRASVVFRLWRFYAGPTEEGELR